MSFSNYIGQTLDGKYRIESEIGRGGMGTVFLSTHIGTERPVALKIIAPQFMQREEFVERFRREARAAGRLRHPNVVDVTDFGLAETKDGKVAYLVMEYLDGCTLGEILEEEKNLPVGWTIDILEQVCSAVHEAHEQGIIHRDLKPDNIWLEPNPNGGYTVKVLDFGIAKLEESFTKHAELPADYQPILPSASPARATVADFNHSNTTIADGQRAATAVSESATIAQFAESNTIFAESGTLIQSPSESGTLIQPLADVHAEDKTAIFGGANQTVAEIFQEDIGTKIITENPPTENLPENKITDDSLKKAQKTAELTRVGAVLGTPLFMSPEQVRGEKLSARSDIYSLGVIAYRMLGGKTPFDGDFQSVMDAHKDAPPPPLEAKKVPKRVRDVVMCALSKDLEERPQTAQAFAAKLRAGNEGIGELLRKSLVIYSENLPKFMLIAILAAIPTMLLTFSRLTLNLFRAGEYLDYNVWTAILSGGIAFIGFFVQIFSTAFMVGVTTWVVAQKLAVPLRPINLRAAFTKAKSRWKPLAGTVTFSTLLSMLGMVLCVIPGILLSARFMLIAPAIMMENVSGKAAFRRSAELTKRSYRTVLTTVLLIYVVPGLLGFAIGASVGAVVKSFQNQDGNIQVSRKNGQINITSSEPNSAEPKKELNAEELEILNKTPLSDAEKAERKAKFLRIQMRETIIGSIFELIWLPLTILITSFTAVITGLLYFKTRLAGGESMNDLLEQFEETDKPRKKWQERVRNRLIQSGRITSNVSKS